MEKDLEQIEVEFNNDAKKVFFSLFVKFEGAVRQLNRFKDDNVFQQLQGKYVYTLKIQLGDIASELINKSKALKNLDELKKELSREIDQYAREFINKSRSL